MVGWLAGWWFCCGSRQDLQAKPLAGACPAVDMSACSHLAVAARQTTGQLQAPPLAALAALGLPPAENRRVNGDADATLMKHTLMAQPQLPQPRVQFLLADAAELCLPPACCDVIFSNWLLMYLGERWAGGSRPGSGSGSGLARRGGAASCRLGGGRDTSRGGPTVSVAAQTNPVVASSAHKHAACMCVWSRGRRMGSARTGRRAATCSCFAPPPPHPPARPTPRRTSLLRRRRGGCGPGLPHAVLAGARRRGLLPGELLRAVGGQAARRRQPHALQVKPLGGAVLCSGVCVCNCVCVIVCSCVCV